MFITVLRSYCRAVNWCVALVGKSVSYMMPLLALVVAFEVFSRYFLNKPTIWAYDVSLFMFGYIAALGGAYAQQQRAHINVDVIYNHFSPKTRAFCNLFTFALALFFVLVIFDMSLVKFNEAIEFNYRRQSEWGPQMHHFWVMMAVSCTLLAAQLSSDIIGDCYYLFTGKKLLKSEDGAEQAVTGEVANEY